MGKMCKLPRIGIVGGPGGSPSSLRPDLTIRMNSTAKRAISAWIADNDSILELVGEGDV